MSFLKTKQLQAVCPLHAPNVLPRLSLVCLNHLVEVCTAAKGKTPICSTGEKRRSSLRKAFTQPWITPTPNSFFFFCTKTQFWMILYFFVCLFWNFPPCFQIWSLLKRSNFWPVSQRCTSQCYLGYRCLFHMSSPDTITQNNYLSEFKMEGKNFVFKILKPNPSVLNHSSL